MCRCETNNEEDLYEVLWSDFQDKWKRQSGKEYKLLTFAWEGRGNKKICASEMYTNKKERNDKWATNYIGYLKGLDENGVEMVETIGEEDWHFLKYVFLHSSEF